MRRAEIFELFARAAAAHPGKLAFAHGEEAWTFAALMSAVEREIAAMADAPSGPVICDRPAGPAFLARFFAAMASRRPALALDPALPEERLAQYRALALRAAAEAPGLAAEEFYWGLTSGSTGQPKIFARAAASWIASFEACEAVFPFEPEDVVAIPGALSHSLFLYGAVHALSRGLTAVAPTRFAPRPLVGMMRRHVASVLYAVPSMLEELLRCGHPGGALRRAFVGGARLAPALRRRLEAAWPRCDIVEFYGASELSFVSYAATSAPAPEGAAGRLFPGVRLEIRDAGGRSLPAGEPGLIHAAGRMIFSRYPGAAEGGPAGGWATAGDIGRLDADGFLHVAGRLDRELNCKGRKLNPERIEAALAELPAMGRVAVVGVDDDRRGAVPVAALEAAGGPVPARADLLRHCRDRLGAADAPLKFFATDRLPLTRTGKVAFAEVKAALEAGDPAYRELR